MKYLFLMMCVVSAVSLSLLSIVMATGRLPFMPEREVLEAATPVAVVAVPEQVEAAAQEKAVSRSAMQLELALKERQMEYEEKLRELDARENQLAEKEKVLNVLRGQIEQLRDELESRINTIESTELSNISRLAEMYGKMGPEEASTLLGELEPEQAAVILSMVGDRQAAGILAAAVARGPAGASQASEWTDLIRRMDASDE